MQLSRIRLPPRVCNGEALIRPRMEDTRFGEPVVNQLVHPSPGEIGLLTASVEYPMPASGDLGPEHCECPSVHGHRVVVEVAADDMPQPPSLELIFATDPPYYDNIGYANLSDFFYVWLR